MDTSVNAANQVVSVGADIAFDSDPTFFACLVRFESSSVPTTLPTAYDVYPLDGRHDGGYYTVKVCFFFQAEDGIRDVAVTGVQTCALPIFTVQGEGPPQLIGVADVPVRDDADPHHHDDHAGDAHHPHRREALGENGGGAVEGTGIGRASGRGRGENSVGGGSFKKKKETDIR